jgi:hypothetical protein
MSSNETHSTVALEHGLFLCPFLITLGFVLWARTWVCSLCSFFCWVFCLLVVFAKVLSIDDFNKA